MKILNIIIVSVLLLYGCDMARLINGGPYTGDIRQARKAYYDKETLEQKRLRKKNVEICIELYPSDIEKHEQCMKERGSPLFIWKK